MADLQHLATGTEASSVAVKGLTKGYGPGGVVRALNEFTLDFPAGECTVLLGPSGCGKTTVLRSIAGLLPPDQGRIEIGSDIVFDAATGVLAPPEKRRLGMVFQSYALWPHLSIADNIGYPLAAANLPKQAIQARTEAMLEWIGLVGMGGRFVHELSGGQQQRVSLGRALVGNPRAVLFDEPLSNLDARLRERMRLELLALRQRAPFTSIYVTHDQLEAMTLGDRVVVMRAGTIEQVGTPEDVYKRPRTRFTADFMGIPNLVDGVVRASLPDGAVVETVLGPLRTRGWRGGWADGDRCTVAVRPTLLSISAGESDGARPGRVIRSVFQGTSTIHVIDMAGTELTLESFSEERHADGAAISVAPVPGAVFALLDD
ncbi:ABC transporter ATP-binding protein [Bosea sp. BK604]|uniref:ABC transporter ATP-binding protein n=1 Tax=Bosea sp. BK604 TaxID=2512180 RepID=UPI001046F775|nr:ABC transporter ATP-binding protein [Bosea sp. BK604]TCR63146.1 iron(III) transport system ATP-binding protein [Bosea sp. BK604]